MAAPGAPNLTSLIPRPGIIAAYWTPGTGSTANYDLQWSEDSGFSPSVSTLAAGSSGSKTIEDLKPGATYYVRVRGISSSNELGAWSNTRIATVPARTTLSSLRTASINIDGHQIEVRSNGVNEGSALTLGVIPFGPDAGGIDASFVTIDTLLTDNTPLSFSTNPSARTITLVADAAGNIYVVGTSGNSPYNIAVRKYTRTGPTTWTSAGTKIANLPGGDNGLMGHSAIYVPGTGSAPLSTIIVFSRRHGSAVNNAIIQATLDPRAWTTGASLVVSYKENPSYLSYPSQPADADNNGTIDVTLTSAGNAAVLANDLSLVTVVNGKVSQKTRGIFGAFAQGPHSRLLPVDGNFFVVRYDVGAGGLRLTLGFNGGGGYIETTIPSSEAFGGDFKTAWWDAYYDRQQKAVFIYYVAAGNARKLAYYKFNTTTRLLTGPVTATTTFGPSGSTNLDVRAPSPVVDERRVVIETANLSGSSKSTQILANRSGNVAPSAPSLTDKVGFDAAYAEVFRWTFSDPNPADSQRAYEIEISRVSDSVVVYSSGKTLGSSGATVPANTLVNGVSYRWRVRTYDASDIVGGWSSYDTFTTAALGLLTITAPADDNPPGLETSYVTLAWTYSQPDGYVQTSRRIRVLRVSDGAVLSDTGMQASVETTRSVTGLPTDVPVEIELSIVNNGPATPTITKSRFLITSYGLPMVPEVTFIVGPSYVEITVVNPVPTGSRPDVYENRIERRKLGDTDYTTLAVVPKNGDYRDYTTGSGVAYEYRVRGVGYDV